MKCYTRWHIPLAILALVGLLAQALLILFVAASIYYKTLSKKASSQYSATDTCHYRLAKKLNIVIMHVFYFPFKYLRFDGN